MKKVVSVFIVLIMVGSANADTYEIKEKITNISEKIIDEVDSSESSEEQLRKAKRLVRRALKLVRNASSNDDTDGINKAAGLCAGLSYTSEKQKCLDIVSNSYYFSKSAVNVCMGVAYASKKQRCMRIISNKDIRDYEAEICGEMSYSSQKFSCLLDITRIADKQSRRNSQGGDGLSEAAGVCRGLTYDSEKQRCLNTVSDAYYFSKGAVSVCASLAYASEKQRCMRIISNKDIRSGEAAVCGSMNYGAEKQKCLSSIDRIAPN